MTDDNTKQNLSDNNKPESDHAPKPELLAKPTYWPLVISVGITVLAWGAVTSYPILLLGLIMTGVAVVNWIGDIRREQRDETERG